MPEPTAPAADQLVLNVRAAALKHLDKSQAKGTHYSSQPGRTQPARIVGGDAVGTLPDGTRVFAVGSGGTLAERTLIDRRQLVPLPTQLDDATVAALPNAVSGAGAALRFRAALQPGETVLINGATGVTGRVAVQLARHYGAGRIIATDRNPESLRELLTLGADEVVSVQQPAGTFVTQLKALHASSPVDVLIDYLWGHSAELLLRALQGAGSFTRLEVPARTMLLREGDIARRAFFIEKGCLRVWFNRQGKDVAFQFFFEWQTVSSLDSFRHHTPSLFSIEMIEPCVVWCIAREAACQLLVELAEVPERREKLAGLLFARTRHYMDTACRLSATRPGSATSSC